MELTKNVFKKREDSFFGKGDNLMSGSAKGGMRGEGRRGRPKPLKKKERKEKKKRKKLARIEKRLAR